MKESYFTPQNIQKVSCSILKKISEYQRNPGLPFLPEKSALLILDMQNFFLDPKSHAFIPSAPVIIESINNLLKTYLKNDFPIIFTRHINTSQNAKMMKRWWKSLINQGDPASKIINSLDTAESKIITKTQYDAFYQTELQEYLVDNNIQQLVVTGVMTHLCCESTIRSAFIRGFTIFFPVNATATYNLDFHTSACINLSHGFAVCTLGEELEKKLCSES